MESVSDNSSFSFSNTNQSSKNWKYGLFEVMGIEMEYMIVDKNSLSVKPLCDVLMKEVAGEIVGDFDNGAIVWSNEIVNHLVEIKTNGPVKEAASAIQLFHDNVLKINNILELFNAVLMPTAAHPWMNPYTETHLWQHDSNEIYNLYNRIFNCSGHGWSNLQSTHINLPFANDEEFGKLHAAIRVLLPVLPALCASSPILDGKPTGVLDTRLETYRFNQQRIPSITGSVIPERAFSESAYYNLIYAPMMQDVAPFDPDGILESHFLNSRGAIARFDRGAIEIRVLDIQECPLADLAIAEAVKEVLKLLLEEVPLDTLQHWHEKDLAEILLNCITSGERALITNMQYLSLFGIAETNITAGMLWKHLQAKLSSKMHDDLYPQFKLIVENGTLSSRIMRRLNNNFSHENIKNVYRQLVQCLNENKLFL